MASTAALPANSRVQGRVILLQGSPDKTPIKNYLPVAYAARRISSTMTTLSLAFVSFGLLASRRTEPHPVELLPLLQNIDPISPPYVHS